MRKKSNLKKNGEVVDMEQGDGNGSDTQVASKGKGVKMNPKKKKRLDSYIKKKLAKEEKAELIEKLSKSTFTSDLMLSSKTLGQSKMTVREKLRYALNQQRAGLQITDKSIQLTMEKDYQEYEATSEQEGGEESVGLKQHVERNQQLVQALKPEQQGKVILKMGSALKKGGLDKVIPLKEKKKNKMVSVRELLKRVRPDQSTSEEDDSEGTDSSFDSSESEGGEDDEMAEEEKIVEPKKSVEDNPTTSLSYLQAPIIKPQEKIILKPKAEPKPKKVVAEKDKAFYVAVNRTDEIKASRIKLPICGEEQQIMEAIAENDCVILCGETGSGKTTQLPQFLFEAGYGDPKSNNPGVIGITQPRRVAALSMANRVGTELNMEKDVVSYQIRYDRTVSNQTRIKFMTDGVLLRELSRDLLLPGYSCLILDEAHERTLNTDILIGVLSRSLRLRNQFFRENKPGIKPLKLVIMSATLRVDDFVTNRTLFPTNPPPVIKVDARQYPVTTHFNKRTPHLDYLTDVYKKVVKIHTRLPEGGILIFLTGQNEILDLCSRLKKRFPVMQKGVRRTEMGTSKLQAQVGLEDEDLDAIGGQDDVIEGDDLREGDDDIQYDEHDTFEHDFGDSEEEGDDELELSETPDTSPLLILPLYSMLPTDQQLRIFQEVPAGYRLCVVATNVAETSLTIPNIKYVVDCGKVKEKVYDGQSGVSKFEIGWCSKASADQRAGRAGRTGPGHCYRVFSSAVFNDRFEQFSQPEIFRSPIEGVVLQMKGMNLDNVVNFPFPTPPPSSAIKKAERLLTYLGAVDEERKMISPLGTLMATFPVAPRFSKMLAIGQQHGCMAYTIAIVAALSVGDPFLKEHQATSIQDNNDDDIVQPVKRKFHQAIAKFTGNNPVSDLLRVLNVIGAYEYGGGSEQFCTDNFVRPKAMEEIRKMRQQLTNLVQIYCPSVDVTLNPKLPPPTPAQQVALRQIILAGFVDQVAVLKKLINPEFKPSYQGKGIRSTPAYSMMWGDQDIYIHPSSSLYLQDPPPKFLVYGAISATASGTALMQDITQIDPKWLTSIAKPLVSLSKPLEDKNQLHLAKLKLKNPDSMNDQLVTLLPRYGPRQWPLPNVVRKRSEI